MIASEKKNIYQAGESEKKFVYLTEFKSTCTL